MLKSKESQKQKDRKMLLKVCPFDISLIDEFLFYHYTSCTACIRNFPVNFANLSIPAKRKLTFISVRTSISDSVRICF